MHNPISAVPDVGLFGFKTYYVDTNGKHLIDSESFDGLYKPVDGEILYGLSVTSDNYVTYSYPSLYTIHFTLREIMPRGAIIKLTIPTKDISIVDLEYFKKNVFVQLGNGEFIQRRQVTVDEIEGSVTIGDAFTRSAFDPSIEPNPQIKI